MKDKKFSCTINQLEFIRYLSNNIASPSKQEVRLERCISQLPNQPEKPKKSNIILVHSPQKMIEFLSLFSRDDRFKWFTHKWDMTKPFNIDEEIKNQRKNQKTLSDMVYSGGASVNEKTYNQVWNFINYKNSGEKVYTWRNTQFEHIKYGWHSLVDISKKNPGIPIENLKLDNGRQFKDYIRMFKSTIEFRTDLKDEDHFSELIWKNITDGLPKDFEINFSREFDKIGYEVNVYCDVIGIIEGISTICNWMVRHKSISSKVSVDLINENGFYILNILHLNSYFNNKEKLTNPSGDFEELRKRLFSVCDLTLEGDVMEGGEIQGSVIVNALDNNTQLTGKKLAPCKVVDSDKKVGGVKYQFKIYKR